MGKPSQQGKNPFDGMNFERMAPIYRGFGEFVDGLERHADGLSGSETQQLKQHLKDLVKIYRDKIMPQLRTWISDANEKKTGFRVDFTHDQLMINWGNAPEPSFGATQPSGSPEYAASGKQQHPIFGDVNVRHAMAYAIDVQSIVDSQRTFGTWSDGYVRQLAGQPGAWDAFASAVPGVVTAAYDPELAARLLDEAGWERGPDGVRHATGLEVDAGADAMLWFGELLARKQPAPTRGELDGVAGSLNWDFVGEEWPAFAEGHAGYDNASPDSLFWDVWGSSLVNVYYNREMFEAAGLDVPEQDWDWEKLIEIAPLLTVDADGRNASDPNFDPQRVVQYGWWMDSWTAETRDGPPNALPVYDPKLLRGGDERRQEIVVERAMWWRSTPVRIAGAGAAVVLLGAGAFSGYQLFSGDGGSDDRPGVVTLRTPSPNELFVETYNGVLSSSLFLEAQLEQSTKFGFTDRAVSGNFVITDPLGDGHNPEQNTLLFDTDHFEITAGSGVIISITGSTPGGTRSCGGADPRLICYGGGPTETPAEPFPDCGSPPEDGFEVVCPEGAVAQLPEGEYALVALTLQDDLGTRQDGMEYQYAVYFDTKSGPVVPGGSPSVPYTPLQGANLFYNLAATGAGPWSLAGRTFDDQQAPNAPTTPPYDRIRAAVDGNVVVFLVPRELLGDGSLWRVSSYVHTSGVQAAPENVAMDVSGRDALEPLLPFADVTAGLPATDLTEEQSALMAALQEQASWVQAGDADQLVAHLDQSAIDHYGEDTCRDFFSRVSAEPSFGYVVRSISGPEPWEWNYDGETIGTIPDAYTLDVQIMQRNVLRDAEIHFALKEDGSLRIFSPCRAPSAPPTATPPAGLTPDVEAAIRAGMERFAAARRTGNGEEYLALLHPIVLQFFGEDACRAFYTSQVGPDAAFAFGAVTSITGPAPYNYVTNNGTAVGTAEAYSVVAETTTSGGTQTFTWHFAIVDGQFKIFQPCAR